MATVPHQAALPAVNTVHVLLSFLYAYVQLSKFGEHGVSLVHGDILLTKLAPGQQVDLFMVAHKGVGKDHAKFSPVCTATYRMLPSVTLSREEPFCGDEAVNLASRCPADVFDVEDLHGK
jgi:DNA-directed RNA polymerases I and III subunit RPAC1